MTEKKRRHAPTVTVLLFVLAALLLIGGTIGGIRAALLAESQDYHAKLQLRDLNVTLLENGSDISLTGTPAADGQGLTEQRDALLSHMLDDTGELQLGRAYDETLRVRNDGAVDVYLRVSLYRYWQDENGTKLQTLSPDLIQLELLTQNGWIVDDRASTAERTVLYYTRPLRTGETTPELCRSLRIDPAIRTAIHTQTALSAHGDLIIEHYDYHGVAFRVEAVVDAVQDHNAEQAICSAWGCRLQITDGVLSLPEEGAR